VYVAVAKHRSTGFVGVIAHHSNGGMTIGSLGFVVVRKNSKSGMEERRQDNE
jgi:hypothetical protein